MESVRGRDVLFRSNTGAALNVVSQGYLVVQPGEVLDFFGKLAEAGGFTLETAGALSGGRRVWGLAKVHDGAPVIGHDVVRPYLLLATSYDGTMATTAKFTAIRVVCHNTLTMAAGSASGAQTEQDGTEGPVVQCVRVPYMTKFQPEVVRHRLGIVLMAWERWLVEARPQRRHAHDLNLVWRGRGPEVARMGRRARTRCKGRCRTRGGCLNGREALSLPATAQATSGRLASCAASPPGSRYPGTPLHTEAMEPVCFRQQTQSIFFGEACLLSTLRSNEQHDIKRMIARGTIKLKLAQEFCRWSGASTTFRTLVPPRPGDGEKESYHNTYRAIDIRHARLRLMDVFEEPTRPRTIPPIINVRMAKGGTGKTTVAANLAACIAMQGYRVLMIDADPQASLTTMWGIDWAVEDIAHIGHLLQANESKTDKLTREELEGAIRPIYSDGMLDLIASDITLTDIDTWLTSVMGRELLVAKLLNAHVDVFSRYDAIIIDGAPGTTQLSNALAYAAPHLLAVVMLDGQSIKAMEVLAANMQEMHEAFPERPFDVRIVANKFSSQITACRDALETLRAAYPGKLDSNIIPTAAGFLRQVSLVNEEDSGPVIEREPSSPAARAMIDLSRSVIGAYDIQLAGLTPVVMPRRQGGSSAVRAAMKKVAQQEPDEQAAQPGKGIRASKKQQTVDATTAKERA